MTKIILTPPTLIKSFYLKQASSSSNDTSLPISPTPSSPESSPRATPSPHHRASLTQQLMKRFSFSSLRGDKTLSDLSPEKNTTTSRPAKYNALHQWTPDQLLQHHYRDMEQNHWVRWEDEDDEDESPQSAHMRQILYQTRQKHENAEIYMKQGSETHFFAIVLKKQVAYNDDCEVSHEVWTVDRVLDEDEWLNVNMRVKEWKEGRKHGANSTLHDRGVKIGALLKLVQQEHDYRNQFSTTVAISSTNAPPNKRASMLLGSSTVQMFASYSSLKSFTSYLETHYPTLYTNITKKIISFNQNFIILRGADLGSIARKVDAFHQRFLQDALQEMKLKGADLSDDTLYEDEEDEEFIALENYLNSLTRSMVEAEMYEKIFNGVWKPHFEQANKAFLEMCAKLSEYTLTQLGLEDDDLELFTCDQKEAVSLLHKMDECRSSYEKLMCVKMCIDCVTRTVVQHQASVYQQRRMQRKKTPMSPEPLTSDQLIPIFTHIILSARPKTIESNLSYMDMMKSESQTIAEVGFALVTLSAAVEHVKQLVKSAERDAQQRKLDARRGRFDPHHQENTTQSPDPSQNERRKSRRSISNQPEGIDRPPIDFSLQENRRSSMHLASGTRGNFIDDLLSDDSDSDDSDSD